MDVFFDLDCSYSCHMVFAMSIESETTGIIEEVKQVTKSIRYTPEQKQEVVDFVVSYNNEHTRGGQTKASEKFKISPITVGAWLDAAGVVTPKNSKSNKTKTQALQKSSRYPDEFKQEVVAFVANYNAEHGRGGQNSAAKKYGISPITVTSWLGKRNGQELSTSPEKRANTKAAAPSAALSTTGFEAKLKSLLALSQEIAKAQTSLKNLETKFNALKASL